MNLEKIVVAKRGGGHICPFCLNCGVNGLLNEVFR